MRRRTTLQIVESLKTARNHAERLELLRSAGLGQLKKIGRMESMMDDPSLDIIVPEIYRALGIK